MNPHKWQVYNNEGELSQNRIENMQATFASSNTSMQPYRYIIIILVTLT